MNPILKFLFLHKFLFESGLAWINPPGFYSSGFIQINPPNLIHFYPEKIKN